jgi:transposase
MGRPRKYPPELRERALRLVLTSGRPIAHIAEELGVHKEALRTWVRQERADRGELGADGPLTSDEREELKGLRKRVAELEADKEILLRASSYFASELGPARRR